MRGVDAMVTQSVDVQHPPATCRRRFAAHSPNDREPLRHLRLPRHGPCAPGTPPLTGTVGFWRYGLPLEARRLVVRLRATAAQERMEL